MDVLRSIGGATVGYEFTLFKASLRYRDTIYPLGTLLGSCRHSGCYEARVQDGLLTLDNGLRGIVAPAGRASWSLLLYKGLNLLKSYELVLITRSGGASGKAGLLPTTLIEKLFSNSSRLALLVADERVAQLLSHGSTVELCFSCETGNGRLALNLYESRRGVDGGRRALVVCAGEPTGLCMEGRGYDLLLTFKCNPWVLECLDALPSAAVSLLAQEAGSYRVAGCQLGESGDPFFSLRSAVAARGFVSCYGGLLEGLLVGFVYSAARRGVPSLQSAAYRAVRCIELVMRRGIIVVHPLTRLVLGRWILRRRGVFVPSFSPAALQSSVDRAIAVDGDGCYGGYDVLRAVSEAVDDAVGAGVC